MSLSIRLTRGGAKKRPFYRIVVADSRSPRDGRFIEKLGHYDPMAEKGDVKRLVMDIERIKHWLSVGAAPSERVSRMLSEAEVLPKRTWNETPKKSAPKAKTQERNKAAAAATSAASAAAAAAAEAPTAEAAAEAPAQ